MPDGGLVMCHPGQVDAELQRLDPLTDLREREYAYFCGDDFRRCCARMRFALHDTEADAPHGPATISSFCHSAALSSAHISATRPRGTHAQMEDG